MKIYGICIFIVIAVVFCSAVPSEYGFDLRYGKSCSTSDECSYDDECLANRCVDPCTDNGMEKKNKCGIHATCSLIREHAAICKCDFGFVGDPYDGCVHGQKHCNYDEECGDHERCYRGVCKDVCNIRLGSANVDQPKCDEGAECMYSPPHQAYCLKFHL